MMMAQDICGDGNEVLVTVGDDIMMAKWVLMIRSDGGGSSGGCIKDV